ncbi:hypothetical protein BGZ65_000550, partial [Modicella reniformis]
MSMPDKSQKVVLYLRSNTVHCERIVPQVTNIIRRRENLEKIVMSFRDDMKCNAANSLLELKEIDTAYSRQRNLKLVLVENGSKSITEVEFRDPAQSYADAPSGQHYRGLNSDMYILWINHQALGFTGEPSSHHPVKGLTFGDPVVSFIINEMDVDDIRKSFERLTAEPPRSIKIICDNHLGVKEWFAACGLAAVSWMDLPRLELRGHHIVQFIEDLHRVF